MEEDQSVGESPEEDSVVEIIPPAPFPTISISGEQAISCQNSDDRIGKTCNVNIGSQDSSSGIGREWSRSEIDGLFCPICMEGWTNVGDHQVSCLPCGHIYGLSCIKKWIQQGSKKCPQCNKKCTLKNVRVLYASRICVVEEELQKKVRSLEAQCYSLQKMNAEHGKEEVQWQKKEAELQMKVHQLKERTKHLESLLEDKQSNLLGSVACSSEHRRQVYYAHNLESEFGDICSSSSFTLQSEFQVEGARYFDVDASGQILLIAGRLSGMGGMHILTKISLLSPHDRENIHLPANTKAVRDLRVSPHSRLVLVASLGKKLSALSTESNNTILSYDLPRNRANTWVSLTNDARVKLVVTMSFDVKAPAWSCSWDISTDHYIYTGLQNGMLMAFDMRQTRGPVESISGLASNPVHTVESLSSDSTTSGVRTVLSASSIGICEWNFGGAEERPILVSGTEDQGVCISLVACSSSDKIVASFRPKVEIPTPLALSSPFPTPVSSNLGHGVHGLHVVYNRTCSGQYENIGCTHASVNDVRLPKSAIISRYNHNPLFAFAEEITSDLVLQDLTLSTVVQRIKVRNQTIRDVRYTSVGSSGLLGCLSEDTVQLFYSS